MQIFCRRRIGKTLWAFPKRSGRFRNTAAIDWETKFPCGHENYRVDTKITFPRVPLDFSQNVVGNVNHVSDTLFAFPKAFSRTFPETLRKRKLRFQSRPWRKRRNLRKRDLRFRDAKNVSETHRIFGNVICVSDENGNAKKKRDGNASTDGNALKTKRKRGKNAKETFGPKKVQNL